MEIMYNINEEIKGFFKLRNQEGVLVTGVAEDSPAEKGGLKRDDVVLKINGRDIKNVQDIMNIIGVTAPGSKVLFTVDRNGRQEEVSVKVGTRPAALELGVEVEDMSAEFAKRFGYRQGEGVLVTKIDRKSPAGRAEIGPGMAILSVNRREVNSVEEFNEALAESIESKKVRLLVRDDYFSRYVVLELE